MPDGSLLTGKVAVVTGGGGGIGRAIAEMFAVHGARVVVAEVDSDRAADTVSTIRDAGGDARAHVVDVRERDQVTALANATIAELGRVDVLVNNVGLPLPRHALSRHRRRALGRAVRSEPVARLRLHQGVRAAHGRAG